MARLFWGTTTFDLKLEHLLPAISRFLSTGGDQETTLIDQAITEHRTWKMGGARGPFVGLGIVLEHLRLFKYVTRGDDPFPPRRSPRTLFRPLPRRRP